MPGREFTQPLPDNPAFANSAAEIIDALRKPGGCFYVDHNPAFLDVVRNKSIPLEVNPYPTMLRHRPRQFGRGLLRTIDFLPQETGFAWAPEGDFGDLRINYGLAKAAGKQATAFLLAWTFRRDDAMEARRLGEEFIAPSYSLHYCPPGMAISKADRALTLR